MVSNDPNDIVSSTELHGIQLRMAADSCLEKATDLETRTDFLLRRVQAMVDAGYVRIAIQESLENGELGI